MTMKNIDKQTRKFEDLIARNRSNFVDGVVIRNPNELSSSGRIDGTLRPVVIDPIYHDPQGKLSGRIYEPCGLLLDGSFVGHRVAFLACDFSIPFSEGQLLTTCSAGNSLPFGFLDNGGGGVPVAVDYADGRVYKLGSKYDMNI